LEQCFYHSWRGYPQLAGHSMRFLAAAFLSFVAVAQYVPSGSHNAVAGGCAAGIVFKTSGTAADATGSGLTPPTITVAGCNIGMVAIIGTAPGKTTTSISDTLANTWTACASQYSRGDGYSLQAWYAFGSQATGSDTITPTFSGNAQFQFITVVQYQGVKTTSALDFCNGTAAGTPVFVPPFQYSSPSLTTAQASELLVVAAPFGTAVTYVAGVFGSGGCTYRLTDSFSFAGVEDCVTGSIQTAQTATIFNSASQSPYALAVVALKAQ